MKPAAKESVELLKREQHVFTLLTFLKVMSTRPWSDIIGLRKSSPGAFLTNDYHSPGADYSKTNASRR